MMSSIHPNEDMRRVDKANTFFYQFIGNFSDYYYMLYGKICYLCQDTNGRSLHEERQQFLELLNQAFSVYHNAQRQEINQAVIEDFVSKIVILIRSLVEFKKYTQTEVPLDIQIVDVIPLPPDIYTRFMNK
ncbi:hypothetical protein BDB01DRAFT_774827 [Pilobolus umbonatus]|nr:hypothetical protein BDB01DRAFT_774827 [Pilobolus umbonatus]